MKILKTLVLRGPNFWSRRPALEAWVELGALDVPSTAIPGLYERLSAWLPSLIEHRCGIGERGGFLLRLREGTYPGHILEHVTLELQSLAGSAVGFGKARETSTPGIYKVAIRYKEERVGLAALDAGFRLLDAAIHDKPFDVAGEIAKLKELVDDVALGPSTSSIVAAAEARNIPVRRLTEGSLVQLGHGARQRRVWTAETDRTGAIAEWIAQDKSLTKRLLEGCGVPVPKGRAVASPAEAWETACELGLPVVVKPLDGNHGRAVFIEISTQQDVEHAFAAALQQGSGVLVEQFIPGNEHRVLVVGDRVVAAARGETAYVTGDGEHTVQQLIDLQLNSDPRRGEGDDCPLNPVELDDVARMDLARQGLTETSVPPPGTRVLIQRNGNVAHDVTDAVHPDVAAQLVMAARVVGLDIAGIDLVAQDISRPLEEQGAAVVEINSSPGLHAHLKPATGSPRPVGEAIVDLLFPRGEDGRVPLVCITGTNGKTTVARLLARLFERRGKLVGLACTDGVYVGGRALERGDCAGPKSAARLLLNPVVEAAVLEAGRGGILREGLGFDRCQVAVVTNIGEPDHLGRNFIQTPEQMVQVKRTPVDMVLPTGFAVLKADDPLVAGMAELSPGGVIFFCAEPEHPVLVAHRERGLRSVTVRDGRLVRETGGEQETVAALADLPLAAAATFHRENLLAATAAAWGMGFSAPETAAAFRDFHPTPEALPGRFNRFQARGATAFVDDCHNVAALREVIRTLHALPRGHRVAVYSAGAGRRDEDIRAQGKLLAEAFDTLFLYEDSSATDRAPGELFSLFRQGVESAERTPEILFHPRHRDAVEKALEYLPAGGVALIQAEDSAVEGAVAWVQSWAGRAHS
jgi:cyanophycin synthetase